MPNQKMLLVTTDKELRETAQAVLAKTCALTVCDSAEAGLDVLRKDKNVAVVATGITLPGMNGLGFLAETMFVAPRVVRMIITGDGNYQIALDAVNEGHVFRFLTKPCPGKRLLNAVESSFHQYRLENAEAQLLRGTLQGAVKALVNILEMTHPLAIGRATRIKERARRMGEDLKVKPLWVLEMAVLLSHIGCVGLPKGTLQKLESGEDMSEEEQKLFRTHPEQAAKLLGPIPRMEKVVEIIRHQNSPARDNPPMGGRILRVCLDLDHLQRKRIPARKALELMRKRPDHYDPAVLDSLQAILVLEQTTTCRMVTVKELEPGMVMGQDMVTVHGDPLLLKGQVLSEASHVRLTTFSHLIQVQEPICTEPPAPYPGS